MEWYYSDVDDTIAGTLNDRQSKISGPYPGAMEFFEEIGKSSEDKTGVKLTFLSARPAIGSPIWTHVMKEKMPAGLKFHGLYGTTPAFLEAINYYGAVKWISSLAKTYLTGQLRESVLEYCDNTAKQTYISFAIDKRRNMDRDLLLRPEVKPIMVGDCGEGDLILLLTKNSGEPNPVVDERIPPELAHSDDLLDGELVGNPPNKPLLFGFAHAVSSEVEYGSARPDPAQFSKELKTKVFRNYVDNALHCLDKKILTKESADKIVDKARDWLKKEAETYDLELQEGEDIDTLPPDRQYRIRLQQSIEAFDAYKPANQ